MICYVKITLMRMLRALWERTREGTARGKISRESFERCSQFFAAKVATSGRNSFSIAEAEPAGKESGWTSCQAGDGAAACESARPHLVSVAVSHRRSLSPLASGPVSRGSSRKRLSRKPLPRTIARRISRLWASRRSRTLNERVSRDIIGGHRVGTQRAPI